MSTGMNTGMNTGMITGDTGVRTEDVTKVPVRIGPTTL